MNHCIAALIKGGTDMTYLEKVESLIADLEKHPVVPASLMNTTIARLKRTRELIARDSILVSTKYLEDAK